MQLKCFWPPISFIPHLSLPPPPPSYEPHVPLLPVMTLSLFQTRCHPWHQQMKDKVLKTILLGKNLLEQYHFFTGILRRLFVMKCQKKTYSHAETEEIYVCILACHSHLLNCNCSWNGLLRSYHISLQVLYNIENYKSGQLQARLWQKI